MDERMQQHKKPVQSFFLKTPVLVFCIVITIFLLLSVIDVLGKMSLAVSNKRASEAEYIKLQKHEVGLRKTLGELNTERGVETVIREHYPVAKEGEKVIMIVDEPLPTPVTEKDNAFVGFLKKVFGKKK
jgi:cell division protein FtsB